MTLGKFRELTKAHPDDLELIRLDHYGHGLRIESIHIPERPVSIIEYPTTSGVDAESNCIVFDVPYIGEEPE